jgi:hypothetical protein
MTLRFVALALLVLCCAGPIVSADEVAESEVNNELAAFAPEQLRLSLTNDPTQMLITWMTPHETPSSHVEYVHALAESNMRVNTVPAKQSTYTGASVSVHRALLTDLRPNSVYRYRVGWGTQMSDTYYFKTRAAAAAPAEAKIALFADMGTWGGVVDFLPFLGNDLEVDAAFHLGDLSYGKDEATWNLWGKMLEPVAARLPYMVIPGNWDAMTHSRTLFQHRFATPLVSERAHSTSDSGYYYSFNYGSVHFVMLDSYEDYKPGSAQYHWLESDLEEANRMRATTPWIVACFHSPIYSSNAGHSGGDKEFQAAVEPLLVRYSVDLTFTGHDHGYERSYPVNAHRVSSTERHNCSPTSKKHPIHLLVGIAGATIDPWLDQPAWSAYRESFTGVVKLHIIPSPPRLVVTAERLNGTIADSFTLSRPSVRLSLSGVPSIFVFAIIAVPLALLWPSVKRRFCVGKSALLSSSWVRGGNKPSFSV